MNTQLEYIKIIIDFPKGTFTYSKKDWRTCLWKIPNDKKCGSVFYQKKILEVVHFIFREFLWQNIGFNVFYILEKNVNKNKMIQNHD